MSNHEFLFMITAHDAAPFVERQLRSLVAQTRDDWRAIYVDDASTDGTLDVLRRHLDELELTERFTIVECPERRYKAHNVFQALREHGNLIQPTDDWLGYDIAPYSGELVDDVVIMLDADDWLAHEHALEALAFEYAQGWHVVWSNWQGSDGRRGSSYHLHPFLSPRRQPFVTSHLFSFCKRLFGHVRAQDLQDDDQRWLRAGCDVAIALPLLERTIRRKFIDEVLCIYNVDNAHSHANEGERFSPLVSRAQAETSRMLCAREGLEPLPDNEFFRRELFYFMQAAALAGDHMSRIQLHNALARLGRRA